MSGTDAYHRALGSSTRRRVLAQVTAASQPTDAHSVAAALDVHVTTIRYHLEQLQDAGLVRRASDTARRRGRPRMLYVADTGADDAKDQLIEVLTSALGDADPDSQRARAAGRAWARTLVPDRTDAADPTERLIEVLEGLEFSPEHGVDSIELRSCPFLESAKRHPSVVCAVHRGLVEQILPPDSGARLIPFAQHDRCAITLR